MTPAALKLYSYFHLIKPEIDSAVFAPNECLQFTS